MCSVPKISDHVWLAVFADVFVSHSSPTVLKKNNDCLIVKEITYGVDPRTISTCLWLLSIIILSFYCSLVCYISGEVDTYFYTFVFCMYDVCWRDTCCKLCFIRICLCILILFYGNFWRQMISIDVGKFRN